MPVYRTAASAYCIQQIGFGHTGAAVNTAGLIEGGGYFGPNVPMLRGINSVEPAPIFVGEDYTNLSQASMKFVPLIQDDF